MIDQLKVPSHPAWALKELKKSDKYKYIAVIFWFKIKSSFNNKFNLQTAKQL